MCLYVVWGTQFVENVNSRVMLFQRECDAPSRSNIACNLNSMLNDESIFLFQFANLIVQISLKFHAG